jgi:hypothetical protein
MRGGSPELRRTRGQRLGADSLKLVVMPLNNPHDVAIHHKSE